MLSYPVNPYRSFSNDINACVFSNWPAGVLSGNVACDSPDDVQLCYGKYNGGRALFAVCYNTKTLIAEFTGHELQNGGTVGAANMIDPDDYEEKRWKTDEGLGNTLVKGSKMMLNIISPALFSAKEKKRNKMYVIWVAAS